MQGVPQKLLVGGGGGAPHPFILQQYVGLCHSPI